MSKQIGGVDYKLFFAIFFLVVFGMIMISSVSVYPSFRVTNAMVKAGLIESSYNYFYVIRNIFHVVLSMVVLGFVVKIPYTFFEKYSRQFLLFSIVLLIVVLIIGPSWNGARGWINLPFLPFAIQPTEFLKISLITYFAYFFKRYKGVLHTFSDGFIPFSVILFLLVFLIGLQPDFGTILLIVPLSMIMFFSAGANVKYLFILVVSGMLFAGLIYSLGKYDKSFPESRNKLSYITDRIDNFLSNSEESIKNKTINYQTEQALIAIGSGGFGGLGFGKSIQKFGYLPEVQGDFIFSVIVEELGFIGAFTLILLYLYIAYRGFMIASHVDDLFAKYVATGITTWILLQSFINIGINLNIIPLTGITLPFVSYGGSSLLSLSVGLAILLNISRYADFTKKKLRGGKSLKIISLFSKNLF
ncbi:FtsW/RodA/SpoVE family cell cycle protein [Candidatus Gracilibacteria bacterium]|nr:FtsW/RodA/SpoVE family cell cycle protein [Candidatus Gracilibacteria bacterium]NUJ99221.1 FtsW/RodA/SpoVE family cell cycle protein [Candidatus Gracilibacteria bacterium]